MRGTVAKRLRRGAEQAYAMHGNQPTPEAAKTETRRVYKALKRAHRDGRL